MSSQNTQPSERPPIWGADAIGKVIGRTGKQTVYLLEKGLIPARKIGDRWVADYAALRSITNPK
jgi:hypothetical protein